jgi:DNA processing protein
VHQRHALDFTQQGAALAESAGDVLEVLGLERGPAEEDEGTEETPANGPSLTPKEKRVYGMLGDDPVHINEIISETGLGTSNVLGLLTKLELMGWIEQLPGKMFVRS